MPRVDGGEMKNDHLTDEESSGSSNVMDMAFANIMDELVEGAILSLCFRVHRAVKMDYFPVDGYYIKEKEFELCPSPTFPSTAEKDSAEFNEVFCHMDREAKISLICPHCQKKVGANRFAPHLSQCMGNGQRISGRNASKRINLDAFVSDCDDDENISDYGSSKKRTRKKIGKNSPRRAPKLKGKHDLLVSSMSDATPSTTNYQDMPYEQRKVYLNQMCGVISKHTRKMCMNTLKCSQHTDEQRRQVRQFLLGRNDVPDQLSDDVQIDVDTVDEENNNLRLWDHALISPRSPSPPEILPSSSVVSNSRQDRNIYASSMSRHNQSGYF